MKKILTLMLVLFSSSASADVDYLNLELKHMPFQRDYFIPEQTSWQYELSLNFRANIWRFWLESDTTGQAYGDRFRNMWWDYNIGFSIIPEVDLVWDHRSQHSLDFQADTVNDKYPVRDSFGFRLNFITDERPSWQRRRR